MQTCTVAHILSDFSLWTKSQTLNQYFRTQNTFNHNFKGNAWRFFLIYLFSRLYPVPNYDNFISVVLQLLLFHIYDAAWMHSSFCLTFQYFVTIVHLWIRTKWTCSDTFRNDGMLLNPVSTCKPPSLTSRTARSYNPSIRPFYRCPVSFCSWTVWPQNQLKSETVKLHHWQSPNETAEEENIHIYTETGVQLTDWKIICLINFNFGWYHLTINYRLQGCN